MVGFTSYLTQIKRIIKDKKYDEAYRKANEALTVLTEKGDDNWYMMYYQMAIILAKEKNGPMHWEK